MKQLFKQFLAWLELRERNRWDYQQVILKQLETIMKTLDEVLQAVNEESTVDDSIIVLLTGIKAQLDSVLAGNLTPDQQAKVDAIFAAADANKAKVAAAIAANTPAAPTA